MASQDQEYSETLDQIIRQYQELGRLLPAQQAAVDAAATGLPGFTKGVTVSAQAATKLAGAFTDAMGAMYRGEKGLKAFDGALDKTADALMVVTGALALLGGPITLLAAGLTGAVAAGAKYVKATNEQSDRLYDAFQQMSRSGGAAADGLQGLYNDTQRLGLGIQDLSDFVSMIAESAGDLATFRGSVFQGRRDFARLGKEMEPFREALMNSGMTQKEINEATLGYLRLQSRVGAIQNRTTAELAESTRKYLIEQDALTKLLGVSRKEQEDQRQAARSQEIFASRLLQLRNQGADAAAKQLEDTFLVLNKDSKEVGQGFIDISSGNLRTEAAQKLMRATQGEAMRVQQELSAGQITAAQAADRISRALGDNIAMYGETQGVLGNYNRTFGDLSGQITIASRQLTGGYEMQLAAINKNAKEMGITGDKAVDAEVQRQTDLRLTQQRAMQNMQDFVRTGVEPATKATAFFGRVIERVTKLLPGSGRFTAEYEQDKKDQADLAAQEKALANQSQLILDAKARRDAATSETEREAAEKDLQVASERLRNVMLERDALNEAIAARKGQGAAPETDALTAMQGTPMAAGAAGGPSGGGGGAAAPAAPGAVGGGGVASGASTAAVGGAGMMGGVSAEQRPQMEKIKELIAGVESRGDYNIMVGGAREPLTTMTIGEVLQLQKKLISEGKNSAAGKYQMIYTTLRETAPKAGFGFNDKFDANAQERMAEYLINQRGYQQYAARPTQEGKERFLANLARVWAGLPGGPDGKSYYAGVGNNKAHIGWQEALAKFGDGGVAYGPTLAQVGEKGPEAIIPLKKGSVPVSFPKEFVENISKYQLIMDQVKNTMAATNASSEMLQEAEAIKNRAIAAAGADAQAMLTAFRQMGEELRRQGEANRNIFENMLAAQETTNSINRKILQVSQ